ncbi:MerR family transcriptional regulator [Ureibacillus sp. MALMAid1270]|uniref:MerR family transcriptional regulator n=1 Tax=Ureibacillus sp. MALMAid1270 TaxID=3411629 RepID=UPI003BA76B58
MSLTNGTYKLKKVISIGTVSELTGLTERQIRYYESRKLIFPERSKTGLRKYSFKDIETLIEIANRLEDGVWTSEIRKELKRREQLNTDPDNLNHSFNQTMNVQFKM